MSQTETDKPPKLEFPAPLGTEGKKDIPPPISSDKDSPPKRRGRPPGSTNKHTMSVSRIEDALNEQFTLIGTVVTPFNQYDGMVIIQGTPRMAKALANLAEKNPKVKRNLERMLAGGSYGEVVLAAALIAVPIMANHDLMPPSIQQMYGKAIPDKEEAEETTEPIADPEVIRAWGGTAA